MPEHPFDPVEAFWDAIFSRDPLQIHAVTDPLDTATRQAVIAHLMHMVSDPGWQAEQVKSAQVALAELKVVVPGASSGAEAPKPARKHHTARSRRARG